MDFQFKSGDRVLDGYTILEPVAHGGFGEVYHGRSDGGKEVALKLVQRFLEIELRGVGHCLNLKHPNLVTLYDVRPDSEGRHWIVMEYVSGENLGEIIERHPGGLPVPEVLRWLEGIAAAVEHLHQSGIVHRDLKPKNIFDDNGTVKVGDYGLAKFITASRRSGQTQSVGTLHYMAPEVAAGRYGREVDVYAVGVILYEMLTGRVPFVGESPAEILMKHLTALPDLSALPPAFRGVVGRMLAKRPEDRYGSLAAVLADLKVRMTDAALAEASGEEPLPEFLPEYSGPGVSAWLEAPFRMVGLGGTAEQPRPTWLMEGVRGPVRGLGVLLLIVTGVALLVFSLYFGVASRWAVLLVLAIALALAAGAIRMIVRRAAGWREVVQARPVLSAACVFLTLAALAIPVGILTHLMEGPRPLRARPLAVDVVPLWLLFSFVASGTFCAWTFLLRSGSDGVRRGSSHGGRAVGVAGATPNVEAGYQPAPQPGGTGPEFEPTRLWSTEDEPREMHGAQSGLVQHASTPRLTVFGEVIATWGRDLGIRLENEQEARAFWSSHSIDTDLDWFSPGTPVVSINRQRDIASCRIGDRASLTLEVVDRRGRRGIKTLDFRVLTNGDRPGGRAAPD